MKVLVTAASRHGSTREIADAIAEELRRSTIDTECHDLGEITGIEGYDAVVFGSAIYMGNWLPEARSFAEEHRDEFSKVPVWVFSSGPIGAQNPQPQNNPNVLATTFGDVEVRDHRVFVGKIDPDELGLAERVVVKMVKAPEGDFRDWDDIRGWAKQIAAELHSIEQTV